MNRVVLVGRLSRDPDIRYTPSGKPVVTFNVAVKRTFKNSQGEYESDFVNVVAWNNAENVANFLKKGSLAGVDGRIQTRNYDGQDGKKVYVTEVLAESVQFLDNKPKEGQQQKPKQQNNARVDDDPFSGSSQSDIDDSDLPF